MLKAGRNCWRVERAGRAALIVDAARYFELVVSAMLKARSHIYIIGWDVDTRVRLTEKPAAPGAPTHLGPLLSWIAKARPDIDIRVIVWDEGMLSVPARGTTALRLARWWWDGVKLKWDGAHPLNASHHQKIVVIDDSVAFCGGIDITANRWDTRDHLDGDPGRKRPFTRRAYAPWHDATMAVDGKAAQALGDLARMRWKICTAQEIPAAPGGGDCWPDGLDPMFRDVPIAIARTRAEVGDYDEVREVEALFLELISSAQKRIYIETQYFASRKIAQALAKRLKEKDGPEVVVINPRTGYYWLDEAVMSAARHHLLKELRERDTEGRFQIYSPVTDGSADIYVHAKIMIVDDIFLKVGSANLNNRSMGLDSECDVLVDARKNPSARTAIAEIQCDLLAEHLGTSCEEIEKALAAEGSLIGAIESLRGTGRTLWPLDPPKPGKLRSEMVLGEMLDPEKADQAFEPAERRHLLRGLRR